MEYQVWTKDEYAGWSKVDCDGLQAAQGEILKALMSGKEPLLTIAVPFDFSVKVKEDKIGEAKEGKAERDKGPRVEGKGKVRPGAVGAVPELGEGSGDNIPNNSVPGK